MSRAAGAAHGDACSSLPQHRDGRVSQGLQQSHHTSQTVLARRTGRSSDLPEPSLEGRLQEGFEDDAQHHDDAATTQRQASTSSWYIFSAFLMHLGCMFGTCAFNSHSLQLAAATRRAQKPKHYRLSLVKQASRSTEDPRKLIHIESVQRATRTKHERSRA